jgi:hypothetical protein
MRNGDLIVILVSGICVFVLHVIYVCYVYVCLYIYTYFSYCMYYVGDGGRGGGGRGRGGSGRAKGKGGGEGGEREGVFETRRPEGSEDREGRRLLLTRTLRGATYHDGVPRTLSSAAYRDCTE